MGDVTLVLILFVGGSLASSVIEKIDRALSDIPTTLNKAELLANYEIIHAHDKEIERELQLNPQQELELHRLEADSLPIQHRYYDNHTIEQINAQSHIGDLLYQSDIILTTEQAQMIANDEAAMELQRQKRQAMNWKHWKDFMWPRGVLYYSFVAGTNPRVKEVVRKGANLWMQDTCVVLIESQTAKERVEISPYEPACSSYIGWVHQGVQRLKLGDQCRMIGTAAHEFGHALGMFHTHARHDRDQYLIVNIHNVQAGAERNFNRETTTTNNNYEIPFDYGSIMMYGPRSWIKYHLEDNKAAYTMMPKDINYVDTMGSQHMAFYDVLMLNKMYACLKKCDGVQQSPGQDRLKRQAWTKRITTTKNGRTVTQTISGNGPEDLSFFGEDASFFEPFRGMGSGLHGFNLGNLGFGSMFGGFNFGGLGGEEGGSNGDGVFPGNGDLNGSNGGRLPGEEGELPGEEGGLNPGELPGEEGGSNPGLPGEEGGSNPGGSSSTGGWRDWWNLPGLIGGILPDWIIGAGWDWDHTATPPTTTTTRRPITTQRPKPTTRRPPISRTTTTTPAPSIPSGPTGPTSGPSYNRGKCANGGYPSPRDCSRCACPRGYGGRFCNERPEGAGKVLEAKTKVQTLATKVGWPNVRRTDDKDDYVFEHYWIKAPKGRKIEVKVVDFTEKVATEGCYWVGMEIKSHKDHRLTGYRLCSESYRGRVYKSEGDLVPIIMYSKMWPIDMVIQYRMI